MRVVPYCAPISIGQTVAISHSYNKAQGIIKIQKEVPILLFAPTGFITHLPDKCFLPLVR